MSLVGKNNEQNTADPVTFEDDATSIGGVYGSEGILDGVEVTPGAAAGSVNISAGRFVIDVGVSAKGVFYYAGGTDVLLDNNGSGINNLIVAKVDTANATSELEILAGSAGTDPDLTEASNVYYLPIARVVGTGGAITQSDIEDLGITNNANPEAVSPIAALSIDMSSLWIPVNETWTFSAYSSTTKIGSVTIASGGAGRYQTGWKVQAYQPTDGIKYGIINKVNDTSLDIHWQSSVDLDNEAIQNVKVSPAKMPFGFPSFSEFIVEFLPTGSTQASPSAAASYNLGGSVTGGNGDWGLLWDFTVGGDTSSDSVAQLSYGIGTVAGAGGSWAAGNQDIYSASDTELFTPAGSGYANITKQIFIPSLVLATETTLYLNLQQLGGSFGSIQIFYTNSASIKNPTKLFNNYY